MDGTWTSLPAEAGMGASFLHSRADSGSLNESVIEASRTLALRGARRHSAIRRARLWRGLPLPAPGPPLHPMNGMQCPRRTM